MNMIGNNDVIDKTCNKNERKYMKMEHYNIYKVRNMQMLSVI